MAAIIPFQYYKHQQNACTMNTLEELKPRRICWDDAYLKDLDPNKQYLYISFEPSESQLSRADFFGLLAIQVRGLIWLKLRLVKLMRTKQRNYVLIFTSDQHPTRLHVDTLTLERAPVTFHFFDPQTKKRKKPIVCKP